MSLTGNIFALDLKRHGNLTTVKCKVFDSKGVTHNLLLGDLEHYEIWELVFESKQTFRIGKHIFTSNYYIFLVRDTKSKKEYKLAKLIKNSDEENQESEGKNKFDIWCI